MKRVLCAVDLFGLSVEVLECAAAIVQWYGGCLTILHVVPTFDAVERHPSCPVLTIRSPHERLLHAQHP